MDGSTRKHEGPEHELDAPSVRTAKVGRTFLLPMNEQDVILTIQSMRRAINQKGDHSLFINAAGTLMYHAVGSRGETEALKMIAYDLCGVYSQNAKLADILRDVGA